MKLDPRLIAGRVLAGCGELGYGFTGTLLSKHRKVTYELADATESLPSDARFIDDSTADSTGGTIAGAKGAQP